MAKSDIATATNPETSGSVEFSPADSMATPPSPTDPLSWIGKGAVNCPLAAIGAAARTVVVVELSSTTEVVGAGCTVVVVVDGGIVAVVGGRVVVVDEGGPVVVEDGGLDVVVDVVEVVEVDVVVVGSGKLAEIWTLSK